MRGLSATITWIPSWFSTLLMIRIWRPAGPSTCAHAPRKVLTRHASCSLRGCERMRRRARVDAQSATGRSVQDRPAGCNNERQRELPVSVRSTEMPVQHMQDTATCRGPTVVGFSQLRRHTNQHNSALQPRSTLPDGVLLGRVWSQSPVPYHAVVRNNPPDPGPDPPKSLTLLLTFRM